MTGAPARPVRPGARAAACRSCGGARPAGGAGLHRSPCDRSHALHLLHSCGLSGGREQRVEPRGLARVVRRRARPWSTSSNRARWPAGRLSLLDPPGQPRVGRDGPEDRLCDASAPLPECKLEERDDGELAAGRGLRSTHGAAALGPAGGRGQDQLLQPVSPPTPSPPTNPALRTEPCPVRMEKLQCATSLLYQLASWVFLRIVRLAPALRPAAWLPPPPPACRSQQLTLPLPPGRRRSRSQPRRARKFSRRSTSLTSGSGRRPSSRGSSRSGGRPPAAGGTAERRCGPPSDRRRAPPARSRLGSLSADPPLCLCRCRCPSWPRARRCPARRSSSARPPTTPAPAPIRRLLGSTARRPRARRSARQPRSASRQAALSMQDPRR